MTRILLAVTLFFITFSPQLMAAQAQMKEGAPTLHIQNASPACVDLYDKCVNAATKSNDAEACKVTCTQAETACQIKEETLKKMTKAERDNTRSSLAKHYRLLCQNKTNQQKRQK